MWLCCLRKTHSARPIVENGCNFHHHSENSGVTEFWSYSTSIKPRSYGTKNKNLVPFISSCLIWMKFVCNRIKDVQESSAEHVVPVVLWCVCVCSLYKCVFCLYTLVNSFSYEAASLYVLHKNSTRGVLTCSAEHDTAACCVQLNIWHKYLSSEPDVWHQVPPSTPGLLVDVCPLRLTWVCVTLSLRSELKWCFSTQADNWQRDFCGLCQGDKTI